MAFCKICGAQYEEGAPVCPGCGTSLSQAIEVQAEPVYAEPTYAEPVYAEPVYAEPAYEPYAPASAAKKESPVAMILGIVACSLIFFYIIPLINYVIGFPILALSAVALILGFKGLKAAKANDKKSPFSLVAVITGVFGALSVIGFCCWIGFGVVLAIFASLLNM